MIPYSVDASFDRRPVVNWLILAGMIWGYLLGRRLTIGRIDEFLTEWTFLWLIVHNWLHWTVWLLILDTLFLLPLGNAVCAKIGNLWYAGLFFGVTFIGAVLHLLFSETLGYGVGVPVSFIVGMSLILFPENSINCMFFFPRPVTVEISPYFFVPLWLIFDLLLAIVGMRGVLYAAHVLSFAGGVGFAILMLKKKWVVMEKGEKSLLDVIAEKKQDIAQIKEQIREERADRSGQSDRKKKQVSIAEQTQSESAEMEAVTETNQGVETAAAVESAQVVDDGYIRFYCNCGKRIKVPDVHAGKAGRCPRCKAPVKVPSK